MSRRYAQPPATNGSGRNGTVAPGVPLVPGAMTAKPCEPASPRNIVDLAALIEASTRDTEEGVI
jgi:hypothetical protein